MTETAESTPPPPPRRVVSLLGAATETIYRLGLGDRLVGRSHECDYPPACLRLPVLSRPRLDCEASSADIDAAVRDHAVAGKPVYKVEDTAIAELDPDLLITQDHCQVCAVTAGDLNNSKACLAMNQLVLKPATLEDCLCNVEQIANAMGVPERGAMLRETLDRKIDRVKQVVAEAEAETATNTTSDPQQQQQKTKPKVTLLEWCDPVMGCGYWLPEIVRVAGGDPMHCPTQPGGATPCITFSALIESQPDVVIFALCGFGLTRSANEITAAWGRGKLQQLTELCDGRVFVVDGNYLINRSGPRVAESCETIAEAIHPALQGHFGHYGTEFLSSFSDAVQMAEAGQTTGSTKVRPAPAGETPPPPLSQDRDIRVQPTVPPSESVATQVKLLREGNMEQAFALNSTANQQRWGGAGFFVNILKTHQVFRRLFNEEPATITLEKEEEEPNDENKNELATVRVVLSASEKHPRAELLWTLICERIPGQQGEEVAWRTEKVGISS